MRKALKIIKYTLLIMLIVVVVFSFGSCARSCSDKFGITLPSWFPSWWGWDLGFGLFKKKVDKPVDAPDPNNPKDGDEIADNDNDKKYIVTFRYNYPDAPNDGVFRVFEDVAHGSTLNIAGLSSPKRVAYKFTGWTYDVDGNNVFQSDKIVESNTDFYAQWTPFTPTVTFNANGGTVGSPHIMQTNENGKLDAFPTVERYGYVFEGWYTSSDMDGVKVTLAKTYYEDTTVYAKWRECAVYTVTFDANGGVLHGDTTMQTNNESILESPPSVTLTDYYYAFWSTIKDPVVVPTKIVLDEDGKEDLISDLTGFEDAAIIHELNHYVFTSDMTLYAHYVSFPEGLQPNVCTVTFDANGGILTDAEIMQTKSDGKLDELPTNPEREGYIFVGWYNFAVGGYAVTTEYVFYKDATVYAHWKEDGDDNGDSNGDNNGDGDGDEKPKPDVYTVTFDANDGTLTGAEIMQTKSDGKLDELPTNPEREGYSFVGWYTAVDGGYAVTTEYVFYKDTTVYAHWQKDDDNGDNGDNGDGDGGKDSKPDVYTVTFDANSGTLTGAETMQTNTDGKLDELSSNPSRDGYIFLGWFTATTGGSQITLNTVFTSDSIVYARWKKATYYMITFDPSGGSFSETGLTSPVQIQTDAFGRINAMPKVTRKNYNFQDWYCSGYGTIKYTTVFTANTTVTARWTETSYTVDFNMNGGMIYDSYGNKYDYVVSCFTGDGFKVVNPPSESYITRDNFLFAGWYTDRTGGYEVNLYTYGFDKNTTLYAHWQFDDSSFGQLGDRVSQNAFRQYSYCWTPSDRECHTNNNQEAKIMFIFDSPTTYNDFDVSVYAPTYLPTISFDINPTNFARFVIEDLTFDYPAINFGFSNLTYDLSGNGGVYGSFDVDDSFCTDGDCYIVMWVTTSPVNYPDDSLGNEILSRINCNSSNYTATYKGFTYSDNFVVYIHTTSPDYAISEVKFVSGSAPSTSDTNSSGNSGNRSGDSNASGSDDNEFAGTGGSAGGTVLYGLDYSRLLGGSYAFPIRYLIDENGCIMDFTITVTIKPMTEIPQADANRIDGSITVESVADIQTFCYYNSEDGIASLEYYGDLTDYEIGIYCPETGESMSVMRHYTYDGGGSVIFEWDAMYPIIIKIFGNSIDDNITSVATFDDPYCALDSVEYVVLFDSTNNLVYFVYTGYIGDYEITLYNPEMDAYCSYIFNGVFGEDSEYAGYSYLVFDCRFGDYSFKVDSNG